ncbi:MAG: IS4 family transposase [Proteobacteria bacterium]|nr:IS4 family transposase [Pseudomonadota bacterium]
MSMQGSDVREVFEAILPDEALTAVVQAAGLQQRERRLNALVLLRSMVVSASTGRGGRQADAMKMYFESGGPRVVRGGFYGWFGPALERAMEGVRDRALAYVAGQALDLPGLLGRTARDWHIVDATTVRLADALMDEYPGAGAYAALKVHKRYSVGMGTTVAYHLSPAREHDAPHLKLDESWRGLGLLVDLGYASLKLLSSCDRYGVSYVLRLKENWKPKVLHVARGSVSRTFAPGTDLDLLLQREVLKLDGKVIDADVELGHGSRVVGARLVGVSTPKGYCFYLTNLAPDVAPRAVADLYRVRWEIELDNKLDKSCLRLDDIGAKTGPAVRALVHAAMVASVIVCMLAHHHRRREAPPPRGRAERTKPPLHPQALARMVAVAAFAIGRAFELSGREADLEVASPRRAIQRRDRPQLAAPPLRPRPNARLAHLPRSAQTAPCCPRFA